MGMRNYIKTISDLETLYYSKIGSQYISKTDAPVITTTTGVYNAVFGSQVWANLNMEANAFSVLPKVPWTQSGWRAITARSSTSVTGGLAENASLPTTVKPTFAELSVKPKTVAHNFDVSEVQEFLASSSSDDSIGDMAFMRGWWAKEHKEHINKMLLDDVTDLASNNIDSIDRVVSSYAEVTNCGDVDANDSDIYSQDRDAEATWTDATVLHNSNTNRTLTDTLLRTLLSTVRSAGGEPSFWLTGYDTYSTIQGLYETQVRYNILGEKEVKIGVNGVQSPDGIGFGSNFSTLYGLPMILSKNVVDDGGSRVYLLDTSNPEGFDVPRLSIKVAKPTQLMNSEKTKTNYSKTINIMVFKKGYKPWNKNKKLPKRSGKLNISREEFINSKLSKDMIELYKKGYTKKEIWNLYSDIIGWYRVNNLIKSKEMFPQIYHERKQNFGKRNYSNETLKKFSNIRSKLNYEEGFQEKCRKNQRNKSTKIELLVENRLKLLGIGYIPQKTIGSFTVDFLIPQYNIVIECDGNYWHNLPEVKKRDIRKNKFLLSKGYKVIRFSEDEFISSSDNCFSRVSVFIGDILKQV